MILAPSSRRAFTRRDLLALAAISILAGGLCFSAALNAASAASRRVSENNLSQICLATVKTADDMNGKMPPGQASFYPTVNQVGQNNGFGPCLFHVLPNLDQAPLYKSAVAPGPARLYFAKSVAGNAVKTYTGPGDPTHTLVNDRTSYVANNLAMPFQNTRYPASFSDGTSQTILYAEAYAQAHEVIPGKKWTIDRRWWEDPSWIPTMSGLAFQIMPKPEDALATIPQGYSGNFLLVTLADRSVRAVKGNVSATTFYAACTPQAADLLGGDW